MQKFWNHILLVIFCALLIPSAGRAHYLNPDTGRFWSMDSYAGNNEDPLSLHKYLYSSDNPVSRVDPSGHDDLMDLLATTAIDSGLCALTSVVVQAIPSKIYASFIPQSWIQALETYRLDAIEVGGSVNANAQIGKLPVGLSGSFGVEALWSPYTHNLAAYFYGAAGATIGQSGQSKSGQGNLGFVFGTPDSYSYRQWFTTISIPYKAFAALPSQLTSRINNLLSSTAPSSKLLQTAAQYGVNLSATLNKANISTVNFFKNPTGSSCGINFGFEPSQNNNTASGFGFSFSYYWQFYPSDNVPF